MTSEQYLHVPVSTLQGTSLSCLLEKTNPDHIAILGAGVQAHFIGNRIIRLLPHNLNIVFVDKCADKFPNGLLGKEVIDFASFERRLNHQCAKRLLFLTPPTLSEEAQKLTLRTKKKGAILFNWRNLSRPEAVIEICGATQLKQLSVDAPSQVEPMSILPIDRFDAILGKICSDFPEIHSVDLSGRNDALLHSSLLDIVKLTKARTSVSVSTSLRGTQEQIETLVESMPDQVIVDFSHVITEENIDLLLKNFVYFLQCFGLHSYSQIRCRLQIFKFNLRYLERLRTFCAVHNVRFITGPGYPESYSEILESLESPDLDLDLRFNHLTWSMEEKIREASEQKFKPCLCQRIFPVINALEKVEVCHLYETPLLAESYLGTDHEQLLEARAKFTHCKNCQANGLHRLDLEVLRNQRPAS